MTGIVEGDRTRKTNTMKATRLNFCTPVRNAIETLGLSYVMALNVCNTALGQMAAKGNAETKTKDLKVKLYKSEGSDNTASVNVSETQKFEAKLNIALLFVGWNDAVAKCEKLCPTMSVTVGESFETWLRKVATPKVENKEQKQSA